jgi:hypothetical protein
MQTTNTNNWVATMKDVEREIEWTNRQMKKTTVYNCSENFNEDAAYNNKKRVREYVAKGSRYINCYVKTLPNRFSFKHHSNLNIIAWRDNNNEIVYYELEFNIHGKYYRVTRASFSYDSANKIYKEARAIRRELLNQEVMKEIPNVRSILINGVKKENHDYVKEVYNKIEDHLKTAEEKMNQLYLKALRAEI